MPSPEGLFWVLVVGAYALIASMFAWEVPEPYMDEIFHVPQCQAFCEGRFSYWDPMITTFPGLYYAALVILSPFLGVTALVNLLRGEPLWSGFGAMCSTTLLRGSNIVLSLVCLAVFREIAAEVRLRSEGMVTVRSGKRQLGAGGKQQLGEGEQQQIEAGEKKQLGAGRKQQLGEGGKQHLRAEGKQQLGAGGKQELGEGETSVGGKGGNGGVANESRELDTGRKRTDNSKTSQLDNGTNLTRRGYDRKPPVNPPRTSLAPESAEVSGEPADALETVACQQVEDRRPRYEDTLKAAALALYPPHFFFAFMFYTDVGSTAAVGAMYLAGLRRRFWFAAALAVVAILIRQTNVVWALFVACTGAAEVLWPLPGSAPSGRPEKRSFSRTEPVSPLALWSLAVRAWTHRTAVLRTFGPLLSVIAGFVAFAVWNGGIVLGAKDAHKMSAHLPQFLYCLAFVFCALAPVQLLPAHVGHMCADVSRRVRRSPAGALALLLAALAAVHWFTLEHPYLLADNRHYPFYLWRWMFKRHVAVKYLLVPGYLYAATSLVLSLAKTQRPFWIFFYLAATLGVLVPAPLIEFRYFNVPFFLAAFHMSMPLNRRRPTLLLQIALFAAVNVGSLYLFVRRTFKWPHEDGTQRFMW